MLSARLLNHVNKIRQRELQDLPLLSRNKHIASIKNQPSLAPSEGLPYWFQGNFAAMFVLNCWLRGFPLFAVANRFELKCETKQLMLFYYKICPCLFQESFLPRSYCLAS